MGKDRWTVSEKLTLTAILAPWIYLAIAMAWNDFHNGYSLEPIHAAPVRLIVIPNEPFNEHDLSLSEVY